MAYEAEVRGSEAGHGSQTLSVEQRGEQTLIGVRTGGQRQSVGVQTGRWQEPPRLYRLEDRAVLELRAGKTVYYAVQGGGLHSLDSAPDLSGAETLSWHEVPDGQDQGEMKAVEPMKSVAPMKPMKPMKPM